MKERRVFSFPGDYEWLEPWIPITNDYVPFAWPIDDDPESEWGQSTESPFKVLNDELHREMPPGHLLHGLTTAVVAACTVTHKDFIFVTDDRTRPIACVHLTWSCETDPDFPFACTYKSLDDWAAAMHQRNTQQGNGQQE